MGKSKKQNGKEKQVLWNKQVSEPCMGLLWRVKRKRDNNLVKTLGDRKWSPIQVTSQIFMHALLFTPKRIETKETKAKISYRSSLKKTLCLWWLCALPLDMIGNDLRNWFMTYLWFGIEMKNLFVWSFIHLWPVFLYLTEFSVSSNASLETKSKIS